MPSTGAAKAEQQRQRRARRAEEQKAIRAERDRLRDRVHELEARLARSEKLDPHIEAVRATVDRNLALRKLAPLEAENARLWTEVERLSSLAFPMTVYPPTECPLTQFEIESAEALAALQNAPVAAWERSPRVAERRLPGA